MKALLRAIPTLMLMVVGATSFLLSYVAIRDVATDLGAVPANLAWAVPVCIDGGILAGSAAIWATSYHRQKRDPLAFLTVATLLATSVLVNISHAGPAPLAKWIAALPPLILLACLEIVASQHRSSLAADAGNQTATARDEHGDAEAPTPAAEAPDHRDTTPATPATPAVPAAAPAVTEAAPRAAAAAIPGPPAVTATVPTAVDRAPAAEDGTAGETAPQDGPRGLTLVETPVAPAASPAPATPRSDDTDATVADSPAARPRRISAAAPGEPAGAPTAATPAGKDADGGGRDQVQDMFQAHVDAGGDPHDRQLAATIAETTGMSAQYVRRVLRPLRAETAS